MLRWLHFCYFLIPECVRRAAILGFVALPTCPSEFVVQVLYILDTVLVVTSYGLPACYEYVKGTCSIHLQGRNKCTYYLRIISSLTQNTSIYYFSSCLVTYSSHIRKFPITVLYRPMFFKVVYDVAVNPSHKLFEKIYIVRLEIHEKQGLCVTYANLNCVALQPLLT
jgi:hypothetical protein